jgi:periplasmic copper chaperone A
MGRDGSGEGCDAASQPPAAKNRTGGNYHSRTTADGREQNMGRVSGMWAGRWLAVGIVLTSVVGAAQAAGHLVVEAAWIRTAPPAAAMRAGYAILRNTGDAPLVVRGATSEAFGDVSIHATTIENGIARMRELAEIPLAAGESVTLEPGGKHLMLMRPTRELDAGAKAVIRFEIEGGSSTQAEFVVRDAPAAAADHAHH